MAVVPNRSSGPEPLFSLLDLRPGDRVLDLGCGTGQDTRLLAGLVGPSGRVVGLDDRAALIAEARRRSTALGPSLEYQVADLHDLPFADDAFDCCRSDQAFQALADPRRALGEMVRVARPGGSIVVSGHDWSTLIVDTPCRRVTDRVGNFMRGRAGDAAARGLAALFRQSGLCDVVVAPQSVVVTDFFRAGELLALREAIEGTHAAGAVSAIEAATWLDDLEWAGRRGRFLGTLTGFVVAGRKPGPSDGQAHRR